MARLTRIALGSVNCYLVSAAHGFVMIDTGYPEKRRVVDAAVERAGCRLGAHGLIVVTQGDYDHAGNAVFLRDKYGVRIAMRRDGAAQVELGDWRVGFKPRPDKLSRIFSEVSRRIDTGDFETFEPDIRLEDGQSLREYGFDATVLHLQGQSRSSLGIVAAIDSPTSADSRDGAEVPEAQLFIDDVRAARDNLDRLRGLGVKTVYPAHGTPFLLERLRVGTAPPA